MKLNISVILVLMVVYLVASIHSAASAAEEADSNYAGNINANILTVGGENDRYTSIQNAVNDAHSGDIIEVSPGVYFENIYVDKSIILRGIGDNLPIIDAGGNGAAITLLAEGVILERFHVVNSSGGGIEVYSNNNVITANYANKNQFGIYLQQANNNNITDNIASENAKVGIEVDESSGNIIENNVANNNSAARYKHTNPSGYGISLYGSSYNIIARNTAKYNLLDAITLFNSSKNSLINNLASGNKEGIYIYRSDSNAIEDNKIIGNSATGMFVESSFYCTIKNNAIEDNMITGLNLWRSKYNILRNNRITNSKYNFDADGPNDIDTSNLIDGKKIYYLVGESNLVIDSSSMAGAVYAIDCSNITVKFLDIRANDIGISLRNTDNSIVCSNHITDVQGGIYLENSKHNLIIGNIIRNCKDNGISVDHNSDGNMIRCNNVSNSLESGIVIQDSWINIIKSNTVLDNTLYGIWFYDSSENTATGNIAKDNLVPDIFINGTSSGNYVSNNKIISSAGISVYDEFVRSLSYSTPGNIYTGNDYVDFNLGCEIVDPCCMTENLCDFNISKSDASEAYQIDAMAADSQDLSSSCSTCTDVTISDNRPPYIPTSPDGPRQGEAGRSYRYSTSATDPDGSLLRYTFDWGDGTTATTTPLVRSGNEASASHIWAHKGKYQIRVKAVDSEGSSSGWAGASVEIT